MVVVAAVVAAVLAATWFRPRLQPDPQVAPPPSSLTDPDQPVARIRGRILLEHIDANELIDPDGVAEPTQASSAVAQPQPPESPPPSQPPAPAATQPPPLNPAHAPVVTAPPPAGACRVTAWQNGRIQGEPATCDGTGDYELLLPPGVFGPLAVELVVPGRLRAMVETEIAEGTVGRLPNVALGLGQLVSGVVVDGRGDGLAGAVIEARPVPDLEEPEPWRTTSGPAGLFAIDTLPPGPVTLRVQAPGYEPTVVDVISPEADLRIVLDRLLDLRGQVIGPAEILARTVVRLEGSAVWPPLSVPVDPTGRFVFAQIPEGVYAVEAMAVARVPGQAEYASLPLENVSPDLQVSLALVEAFGVPVQVVDSGGQSVANARVHLAAAHIGLLARSATTDGQGRCVLGPVVGGRYTVRADGDGFLPADPVAVDVVDQDPELVTLTLARPGSIRGVVEDEQGRPIAQAQITVDSDGTFSYGETQVRAAVFERSLQAGGSLGVTKGQVAPIPLTFAPEAGSRGLESGDDGSFVLVGLAPGRYRLGASHGRYAQSDQVEVRVGVGSSVDGVRLRLRHGVPLTGRVLNTNARPIAGARVELDDGSRYFTDGRGVFDAGLRRGGVEVVVQAPGHAASAQRIKLGQQGRDLEFVLQAAEGVVLGRVVNDNRRPEAGVRITAQPDNPWAPTVFAVTDGRGVFSVTDLPLGPVHLRFDHGDQATVELDAVAVAPGREQVLEVVLQPGWRLRVDVRDAHSDDPIVGARVQVAGRRGVTDGAGVVEFAGLSAPQVEVEARATKQGYGARRVEVAWDHRERVEVVVALEEGGALEGLVTDWRGDPVPGAEVTVLRDDRELAQLRTDGWGRFRVEAIPAGDVVLQAQPPTSRAEDLAEAREASDVLPGRRTSGIDLRLPRR